MADTQQRQAFSRHYTVRWSDLDANRHMANTAYLDFATQVRFAYFDAGGFSQQDFARHGLGPAILEENIRYRRECHMLESLEVTFEVQQVSENGSRFELVNKIPKCDGEPAAIIAVKAVWFDLELRKIGAPPPQPKALLLAAMRPSAP